MPAKNTIHTLGTIQHSIDQIIFSSSPARSGSSSTFLTINTHSETGDVWSWSPTKGISHSSPLSDSTSIKRPLAWSHERHCAPLIDIKRGLVLAMSPQVLNQRDTIRVFRLEDPDPNNSDATILVPHTSIRLSSERPVNIYRYHLQEDGHLLIAANEGEQDDEDEWDEDDEGMGVLARILICDPTKSDSPVLHQLVWHRKEDPFFDSMLLLPTGVIIVTESHYNLEHNATGVTIHVWDSHSTKPLTSPFRSVNAFPMLMKNDEACLASEVTCNVLTPSAVVLCVVESTMDVLPGYDTHQAIIRSFDYSLKETWCAEPIPGTVSDIIYVPSQNAFVAFGAHNESRSSGGVPDWALTATVIDAESGHTRWADKINYRAFGRRRVACSVENYSGLNGDVPSIVVMFDDGTISFTPLERFVEDGFNGIDPLDAVKTTELDGGVGSKIVRGAIGPGIAVFVKEEEFTAVNW